MKSLCATVIVVSTALLGAQGQTGMVEWPYVGGAQAHIKYSALTDIDRSNVGDLEIVWQWDASEMPLPEYGARPGRFQATPLMIDNTLYFSTMFSRVVALDAETGAEKWVYDPKVYEDDARGASPAGFHHRGVAFRRDGDDLHLFLNSRTRLYAINAATGQLIPSFGTDGSVRLTEGHGRDVPSADFDQTSPPVVYDDLVIVGSRVPAACNGGSTHRGPCRRSTRAPGNAGGSSSRCPSRTMRLGPTPGRTSPGGSRVMRTYGA